MIRSIIIVSIFIASLASRISGQLQCEVLPANLCAFSVSYAGSRCILEKKTAADSSIEYECQTSDVRASEFAEWVETDECVQACGIDRQTVGISSDSLMERGFVNALCSDDCQGGCPNIIDLFGKLAEDEGASLAQVCSAVSDGGRASTRRDMGEVSTTSFASASSDTWDMSWEASNGAAAPRSLSSDAVQPHGGSATRRNMEEISMGMRFASASSDTWDLSPAAESPWSWQARPPVASSSC